MTTQDNTSYCNRNITLEQSTAKLVWDLTLSSLSFWNWIFHLWIWTHLLLEIGTWVKINNRMITVFPASILYKSTEGRYRPVSYPDGPITVRCRFIKNSYPDGPTTARCRFIKNAYWVDPDETSQLHLQCLQKYLCWSVGMKWLWPFQVGSSDAVFLSYVAVCFVIICSSSFLILVPREECASWLWHFRGTFTYIFKPAM